MIPKLCTSSLILRMSFRLALSQGSFTDSVSPGKNISSSFLANPITEVVPGRFNEEILCMAVDGANQKWVGTKKGLWLISEEGDKVLYQFTKDNSPLLANEINSLAIDPLTGEVFVATASGICSFRGTATSGTETHTNVLVYPNPVPSGYTGIIGIRGLADNSIVKITEQDGRLVYQTRALGGQATWNGKDYKSNRVSSGVYLVMIADEQNRERTVTKIFFLK